MLNESSITTVSQNAAQAIITSDKLKVPTELLGVTKTNWETIVKIIAKELFEEIKRNAVVEVTELVSIKVAGGLFSTTGPVSGVVTGGSPPQLSPGSSPPDPPLTSSVSLKGKIT